MKRYLIALVALIAAGTMPALAATTLNVPVIAAAPSMGTASNFSGAAVAQLGWDTTDSRSADEPATARILSDGRNLYVKFDVDQREPMTGSAGGDSVAIDLWPNGPSGDQYHYGVGLDGSRTSDSTPNTSAWQGSATMHPGGYTVVMKIPMASIGSTSQVQFTRWIASTAQEQVWAHDNGANGVAQAGTLTVGAAGR